MSASPEEPVWNRDVRGSQVLPLTNEDERFIRVEAGPGTGKTFGLKRRVVRLVHPQGLGVNPRSVLVVAFNRVIAAELRSAVRESLEEYGMVDRLPWITTVHGLCLEILGPETRLLMPHERDAMLYDIAVQDPRLRDEFKDHAGLEQALHDHEAGHKDHALLWQCVQRWLLVHRAQLISDLPSKLLDAIRGGDYPAPRFLHIIADEFQDLTATQHELLFALLAPGGNLTALGDSRQSIYRFLGNDPEGLAKLEVLAQSEVRDFPMTECQRCPAQIVRAANKLMAMSHAEAMVPGSGATPNIHVVHWKTPQAEAKGMARAILESYAAHPDDRHLVMVTRRKFGLMLRDALTELDPELQVDLVFQEGVLNEWAVREAFLFFCLRTDPDPATWRAWFAYRNDQSGKEFLSPERNANSYLNLLESSHDAISEEVVQKAQKREINVKGSGQAAVLGRIQRYFDLAGQVNKGGLPADQAIHALLDPKIWIPAGYDPGRAVGARVDLETLTSAALATLEEDTTEGEDAAQSLRKVARSLRGQVATRDIARKVTPGSVQITTLWSAKGVTANHVYVLGLCEEAIPGERWEAYPGTDAEHVDEQRRLFYVTITRSKQSLVLSRATKVRRGEAQALGLGVDPGSDAWPSLHMSPFLRDIMSELPASADGDVWTGCVA